VPGSSIQDNINVNILHTILSLSLWGISYLQTLIIHDRISPAVSGSSGKKRNMY